MSQEMVEAIKAVLALAWSDGEVSEAEQRLVDFLIDSLGLSPEEEAAVREKEDAKVDLEHLGRTLTSPQDRFRVYEVAALVTLMDGIQRAEESRLLQDLRQALSISGEEAAAAEKRARIIFERFAAQQDRS